MLSGNVVCLQDGITPLRRRENSGKLYEKQQAWNFGLAGWRGVKWRLQFSFALFIIPSSKTVRLTPHPPAGVGALLFWEAVAP
ncbi:hypothetical protein DWB58_06130 [candidate division KSB1 bacterium]|nr:hypothetical protein [candidate division KSB1 bacterium]